MAPAWLRHEARTLPWRLCSAARPSITRNSRRALLNPGARVVEDHATASRWDAPAAARCTVPPQIAAVIGLTGTEAVEGVASLGPGWRSAEAWWPGLGSDGSAPGLMAGADAAGRLIPEAAPPPTRLNGGAGL